MNDTKYDAVIIGAGISGLVCGCYLAKAGMKVLIVEQHHTPGGYCTSFRRGKYLFDAAAHCFGSYRDGGRMRQILADLEIDRLLNVIRSDPSDVVAMPGHRVAFWSDIDRTVEECASISSSDRMNIRRLFQFLQDTSPESFARLRRHTFQDILHEFIGNAEIKAMLSLPLLGIVGLPPSMLSAFFGAKLYSEFLLDGGYYPIGGMQALPDALARRFQEAGGELRLSTAASRIIIDNHAVTGVMLDPDDAVAAQYVIAGCDARETYLELVGRHLLGADFSSLLEDMIPSLSNYIVYLGLQKDYVSDYPPGTFVLYSSESDADLAYQVALEGNPAKGAAYAFRIAHDGSNVTIFLQAPFLGGEEWKSRRAAFMDSLIARVEQNSLAHLSKYIDYRGDATPWTLHRYTRNFQGASFGWAGTPSQLAIPMMRKVSSVRRLYLTGHWTTLGAGISGTAHLGSDTARTVLRAVGK